MKITKKHIENMKHSISGANRNWFATNYNTNDSNLFEELIILGFATKRAAPSWMIDDVIYYLTTKGKKYLNNNAVVTEKM